MENKYIQKKLIKTLFFSVLIIGFTFGMNNKVHADWIYFDGYDTYYYYMDGATEPYYVYSTGNNKNSNYYGYNASNYYNYRNNYYDPYHDTPRKSSSKTGYYPSSNIFYNLYETIFKEMAKEITGSEYGYYYLYDNKEFQEIATNLTYRLIGEGVTSSGKYAEWKKNHGDRTAYGQYKKEQGEASQKYQQEIQKKYQNTWNAYIKYYEDLQKQQTEFAKYQQELQKKMQEEQIKLQEAYKKQYEEQIKLTQETLKKQYEEQTKQIQEAQKRLLGR